MGSKTAWVTLHKKMLHIAPQQNDVLRRVHKRVDANSGPPFDPHWAGRRNQTGRCFDPRETGHLQTDLDPFLMPSVPLQLQRLGEKLPVSPVPLEACSHTESS